MAKYEFFRFHLRQLALYFYDIFLCAKAAERVENTTERKPMEQSVLVRRRSKNDEASRVCMAEAGQFSPRSNNRSVDRPLSTLVVFVSVLVESFIC